jgi:hypothetical protein
MGAQAGAGSDRGGAAGYVGGAAAGGEPDPGKGGASGCGCDDEIDCTVDTCDAQGRCVHIPGSSVCDTDPGECAVCRAGIGCVASEQPVVQLLVDPNFDEQSVAWEKIILDHPRQDYIVDFDASAHTPEHSAWWMATEVDAQSQGYAELRQVVTIPQGTRALTLSGFYQVAAGFVDPAADYVQAGLFAPDESVARLTFHEWAGTDRATNGWTPFEHAAPRNRLQDVVGEQVTFALFGETWDTVHYFDSLGLAATICQ